MNPAVRSRQTKGQDLVEYALMVPIVLLIVVMIFDLGRVTYAYSVLYNAAREGTRYASVHFEDTANRTAEVTNYIQTRIPGLESSDLNVDVVWVAVSDPIEPDRVTITLTYPYDPLTPVIAEILGADPFVLGTRSTMNLEN
jgi:Flp pilus assembly protein TadG